MLNSVDVEIWITFYRLTSILNSCAVSGSRFLKQGLSGESNMPAPPILYEGRLSASL